MVQFNIDPEFESLIPPQSQEEITTLEQSLISDGFHEWEPLIVWKEQGVLIDGHHRLKLCEKHGIPYKVFERSFPDKDSAIIAALQIQLSRRNVTPYLRGILALRYKERIAARAKENQGARTDISQNSVKSVDTQKELARIAGVSHDTISKIETIERDAPVEIRDQVKRGEISINAAHTTIKTLEKANLKPVLSSESEEWYTPPEIIEATLKVLEEIDLDPCSNSKEAPHIPAKQIFTKDDDGLSKKWEGRVYLNPPYGRSVAEWTAKLMKEFQGGDVTEAILLIAARTDTKWFNALNDFPWCAITGRLTFSGVKDPAPFPSAVFYMGENPERFFSVFSEFGAVYRKLGEEDFYD